MVGAAVEEVSRVKSRSKKRRRDHARDLALAYLGAPSVDELPMQRVIDRHIARVLDAADGNLSLAADLLGMHRRSLQRYMRRRKRPK